MKKENFGLPIPGLFFGIASAALTALAFILSKKTFIETGRVISEFHGTWIRILVAFLAILSIDIFRNKHPPFIKQFLFDKQKGFMLLLVILFGSVLGLSFSLIAINRMNAAVAYTIFALLPVSIILVSVIIYKKKIPLKSWLYSALAILGVFILVWRDQLILLF